MGLLISYYCYKYEDYVWYVKAPVQVGAAAFIREGGGVAARVDELNPGYVKVTKINEDLSVHIHSSEIAFKRYPLGDLTTLTGTPYMLRRKKTAYYKNVQVQTEVTTLWRCYRLDDYLMGVPVTFFYYIEPSMAIGSYIYMNKNNPAEYVTSVDGLVMSQMPVDAITEDQLWFYSTGPIPRDTAGDISQTQIVTGQVTIEATADEYDFSAPSLQNYILKKGDTSYVLRRKP